MAQRRPHGQEQDHSRATEAAAWRAEVLKEERSGERPAASNRQQMPERPAARSRQQMPERPAARSRQQMPERPAARSRQQMPERPAARSRQQQIRLEQFPSKSPEQAGRANRPREMSEDDLQEILQQVRSERGEKQTYEEPVRRPKPRERVPEPQKAKKVKKEKKEKKVFSKGFKKGFFIAWGAFALLLIAALVILWTFLSRYESGLPEHYMNQIIEELQGGELNSLHVLTPDEMSIEDPSLFAAKDSVSQYLKEKNAENTLRYVKVNAESTADENIYMIRSGDENLLKVYLKRNADSEAKNRQWEEEKTLVAAEALAVTELTAQIPSSATLMIGQQPVDRSFITAEAGSIQLLSKLIDEGFITDAPTVDTYTVRGMFAEPDVTMTDASGNSVPCTKTGDVYTAGFEADDAFIAEQTERVMSLFEPYAKYFSGDAGREALSTVMLDRSPAFVSASSADVSWMQEHDGISLSEESVSAFRKYSDDCYSCDIRFVQDILRDGESVRTWDTNMTWIMVRDGEFYLADIITKASDD